MDSCGAFVCSCCVLNRRGCFRSKRFFENALGVELKTGISSLGIGILNYFHGRFTIPRSMLGLAQKVGRSKVGLAAT